MTLPSVEGAATDPSAGDHEIEEGTRFIFSLTLDEEYNQSVPVVTADKATVKLRSDGRYEISSVYNDLVISITGIEKNTPTALEKVNSGTKVWCRDGVVNISIDKPQQLQVINLFGSIVRSLDLPAGDTQLEGLAAGIYIIRFTDGTVHKIKCNSK